MAAMGDGDFQTQDWLLKWWNEMFVQKHRCVAATVGWTGSDTMKGPSTDRQTCTAWIFNVGGVSREETVTSLLIPCCPRRVLPLAVKAGGKRQRRA